MPRVFRQQYTRPIPPDAQHVTITNKKGQQVPAVRFKGADGKAVTAPVIMKGKGAGQTCRVPSPNWYGRVNGERVTLCTNTAAAEVMLADLARKAAMGKAGMGDPFEEHRNRPLLCSLCRGRGETDDGKACACPGARTWPTSVDSSKRRATPPSTPARRAAVPLPC
jgi:hypothetical protein